ncbi:MAG: TIGR01440 family protein [Clostridia bacterium]|nr:TIGR01440 family protein [Clostridia bacterium]
MDVNNEFLTAVRADTERAVRELIDAAGLKAGQILVVGCSSSEIVGQRIGKGSSLEAAAAVVDALLPVLSEKGIFLAAQCCEHLNRALIVEAACAEQYGLETVWVKPQPHAGGSFATTVWDRFEDPVAVERIQAHAGMDVGGTLIGMHLRRVAVPVRLSVKMIGEAPVLFARTRPPYIGGPRAQYQTDQP